MNIPEINVLLSLGVSLALYLLGVCYVMMNKVPGRAFVIKVFSAAFIIRVVAAFVIFYSLVSLGGDGFVIHDDRAYDKTATEISRDLSDHRPGFKEYGSGWKNIAYFNINGFVYHYLNFDTMTSRIMNGFFGAIVVVLGYYIMLQLFGPKSARVAAIMLAILPNLIFWSASQVKDPLITLCTMSLIYIMVCKFRSGINIFVVLAYLFFMSLLWFLRKDFCFPLIGASIVWALFRYTFLGRYFNDPRRTMLVKMIVMGVFSIPLLLGLSGTGYGGDFIGTMSKFNEVQGGLATSSGFTRYLRVVNPTDFYKIPPAMAFTAIAPLPTFSQVKNPIQYGGALYSYINLPLVLMMPFIVVGLLKFRSSNMLFTDQLLVRWLPVLTWISLSIIYLGVLRYKAALMTYFMMWAAVGWTHRRRFKKELMFVYAIAVVGIIIIIPIAKIFR